VAAVAQRDGRFVSWGIGVPGASAPGGAVVTYIVGYRVWDAGDCVASCTGWLVEDWFVGACDGGIAIDVEV
jgi:hypothetical protein